MQVSPGSLTAFLRKGWGLNKILPEDKEENSNPESQEKSEITSSGSAIFQAHNQTGEAEKTKNRNSKKRTQRPPSSRLRLHSCSTYFTPSVTENIYSFI